MCYLITIKRGDKITEKRLLEICCNRRYYMESDEIEITIEIFENDVE